MSSKTPEEKRKEWIMAVSFLVGALVILTTNLIILAMVLQ